MVFNILLKILIFIILIIFTTSLLFVYSNTHPPRYPHHIPPSEYNLDYEEVDLKTKDAVVLKGWFVKAKTDRDFSRKRYPVIIISHGLGASKSDFTDFSGKLAVKGYHIFLFDFRGHGESKGRRTSLGYQEQRDLISAIDYIKKREDVIKEKIGLYGFSMGAAVSILTAAKHKNVQAIVSDSSYTSLEEEGKHVLRSFYRLPAFPFEYFMTWAYDLFFMTDVEKISPLDHIAALSPIPVFIIGGEKDEMMPASFAKKLFESAKDPKNLWIIPGARHGETLYRAGDDYPECVVSFFDQYLKEED